MYDAIVLAGGSARRLAGADKPGLRVGGVSLLDRVLAAVSDAGRTVVVGPQHSVRRPVLWCREQPPGGGPVAAIAAGLVHVRAATVLVLAADLPWIAPAVPVLHNAVAGGAGVAVLADADGQPNYLAAAWRTDALRSAVAAIGAASGTPVRRLVAAAEMITVPDQHGWGRDCDTWADVATARREAADKEHQMTNPLDAWVAELASALQVDAAAVDRTLLLDVARDAARGIARPAAPLTTFLVGLAAGRAGGDAAAVAAAAATAQRLAAAHTPPPEDG